MQQLIFRIKDIEAHKEGYEVDLPLSQVYLRAALSGTGAFVSNEDSQADPKNQGQDLAQARLRCTLRYLSGNVLCHGTITGYADMPCQRCLAKARVSLDTPLSITFVPGNPKQAAPKEHVSKDDNSFETFDPDDVDYAHHDREVVDLGDLVREYILLALPMSILCKEDCLGLCPLCAKDRNLAPCSCQPAAKPSPFSVLKDLKL